ncbi:MAG: cation acetate symporter [Burkholderiaceae bacterium]
MSEGSGAPIDERAIARRLARIYAWFTAGFVLFVMALGVAETVGMPRQTIGYIFLAATILLYAVIGIISRTNDPVAYYVAGRRVPAVFNGMATAADWMSAASFIGLAGGLYLKGYAGLAFIIGWTGGYVLVALLIAPYLRRFSRYTIPDFIGARYGGAIARLVAVVLTIVCSFTYVVAQIYAVGLITTWLTGVDFTVGILLGLAGVLVCSFLGGMRAVTWTQVAQYIILIIAYLIPVVWLAFEQTGVPLPQIVYGKQLERVTQIEEKLISDPREREVREHFGREALAARERLRDPSAAYRDGRAALEHALADARAARDAPAIDEAEKALARFPRSEEQAREQWRQQAADGERARPPLRHAEPFPGDDEATRDAGRRHFLALIFCLMLGTAGLPHVLTRYYTTTSVAAARRSVAWSLCFIVLLYVTAPALAVLVKYVIYHELVGSLYSNLPGWVQTWTHVDPSLLTIADVNGDGIVQLAEVAIGEDMVVLATPEIAGLPYVISGLVAAGGLAAALSTADGLLLTITNALAHDLYFKTLDSRAPEARRVLISKVLLLVIAISAALVASNKPAAILDLVAAAFSLAASGLFPALVCGVFWKRATGVGAVAGMLAGFSTALGYMAITMPWLRELIGLSPAVSNNLWWGVQPVTAGVFGVPVGFAVIILGSLLTPPPAASTRQLVEQIRFPRWR